MFKVQRKKLSLQQKPQFPSFGGGRAPPIIKLSAYETNIYYSTTGYPIDNPDERHWR